MLFRIVAILSFVSGAQAGAHEYPALGEYMPVSNVGEHADMMTDVKKFVEALKEKPPNYVLAKHIYENGGGASCKGADKPRTLKAFATKDLSTESFADAVYGTGEAKDYWHQWFMAGLDGTDAWGSLGETQRSVSLQKGAMGLMTWYASHELEAAIAKAKTEANRVDTKAPHAWDEGWAFYYGTDGSGSPWEVSKKRDGDFPDSAKVETAIVPHFNSGLIGVRTATYNEDKAIAHMNVIYDMWTITYLRAALKYLSITEKSYNAKAHAEGYAYWMAISGWAKSKCPAGADALTAALAITQTEIKAGTYCAAKKKIEACYDKLGISCKLVGEYKDAGVKGVKCSEACDSPENTFPDGDAAVAAVEGKHDDVTCDPGPPTTAAPSEGDASSAVISSVGLATLGLGGLLHM